MPESAQDLESSPESDSQDVTEPSSSSDVEQTLEDAIRDVIDQPAEMDSVEGHEESEEQEPGEPTDSSPEEVVEEPQGGEPAAEVDEDARFIQQLKDNDIPLGKIERFQELLSERNDARRERDELGEVKNQLGQIQVAAEAAGLSNEQLTQLFSIPVILANDPAAAFEAISGLRDHIAASTGDSLPQDLQQKVDDGYMDEASAKELAKARASAERHERRAEQTQAQNQERRQQEAQNAVVTAVNTFEAGLSESDPDYSHKRKYVRMELETLVRKRGAPETPEQAVEWAKEAHESVTKDMGFLKPKPKPKRTLSGRGTNRTAASEPQTMFEAVSAAVASVSED